MAEGLLALASMLLGACLPEERAAAALMPLCRLSLSLHGAGARANLARILGHAGQDLGAERLAALQGELAETQARRLAGGMAFHRDPRAYARGVGPELLPALEQVLKEGRGAVLVCPNLGNTSALLCLPWLGLPLTAMFIAPQPSYPPGQGGAGLSCVPLGQGAASCLKALGRGEAVLLPGDMDYFPDQRTAPFFGAPFTPPHGPVRLAQAAGAPLLPVWTVWEGRQHVLRCARPIPTAGRDQESLEAELLSAMEAGVGRHPGQWLFFDDAWDLQTQARRRRAQFRALRLHRAFYRLMRPR